MKNRRALSNMTISLPKTSTNCVTFRIPIQKLAELRTESESKQSVLILWLIKLLKSILSGTL